MMLLFYTAAAVAILATLMVITRTNVVHALLYFIVSLIAVAVVFYTLGATFAAALESYERTKAATKYLCNVQFASCKLLTSDLGSDS